jgi:hypothetical protein
MQRDDRFLLLVPLCASVVALSSLAWHSAPDVGARGASRLRHLPGGSQRGLELAAAAEGAWEAAVTESDEDWPGAGWPGADPGSLRAARALKRAVDAREPLGRAGNDRGSSGGETCADARQTPHMPADARPEPQESGAGRDRDSSSRAGQHPEQDRVGANKRGDGEQAAAGEDESKGDDAGEDAESTIEDEKRVGMCAAVAAEQVQCVLRSGGGARGECSTTRVAACLARLEIARAGPASATVLVHTKYGRMVVPLVDSFEGLALLLYGEWIEWGLSVLEHLLVQGATVLDVNPGTGGATLALARMVGATGRVLVSEPRQFMMQSLAASAHISGNFQHISGNLQSKQEEGREGGREREGGRKRGMEGKGERHISGNLQSKMTFLPCLSSRVETKDMLQINGTVATGLGKVEGADAVRGHGRLPAHCSTVDHEFAHDLRLDLIRISKCMMQDWRSVLTGAAHTLRSQQPILYIESGGRGSKAMELSEFLSHDMGLVGYRCYWSAGRMFRATNWRQVRTNIFDESLSVMYQLCVPGRIDLHGLQLVSADPNHKHKQIALHDVLFSTFAPLSVSSLQPVLLPASVAAGPVIPRASALSEYPQILQVEDFLDAAECAHLILLAQSGKRASGVGVGGGRACLR